MVDPRDFCSWCRNHGFNERFSFVHRRQCPYYRCKCFLCSGTATELRNRWFADNKRADRPNKRADRANNRADVRTPPPSVLPVLPPLPSERSTPPSVRPPPKTQPKRKDHIDIAYCVFCKAHGSEIYANGQHSKYCKYRSCLCQACTGLRGPEYCAFCTFHSRQEFSVNQHAALCEFRLNCLCKLCSEERIKNNAEDSGSGVNTPELRSKTGSGAKEEAESRNDLPSKSGEAGRRKRKNRGQPPAPKRIRTKSPESSEALPICPYCRNHGFEFPLKKHHQNVCLFGSCRCDDCRNERRSTKVKAQTESPPATVSSGSSKKNQEKTSDATRKLPAVTGSIEAQVETNKPCAIVAPKPRLSITATTEAEKEDSNIPNATFSDKVEPPIESKLNDESKNNTSSVHSHPYASVSVAGGQLIQESKNCVETAESQPAEEPIKTRSDDLFNGPILKTEKNNDADGEIQLSQGSSCSCISVFTVSDLSDEEFETVSEASMEEICDEAASLEKHVGLEPKRSTQSLDAERLLDGNVAEGTQGNGDALPSSSPKNEDSNLGSIAHGVNCSATLVNTQSDTASSVDEVETGSNSSEDRLVICDLNFSQTGDDIEDHSDGRIIESSHKEHSNDIETAEDKIRESRHLEAEEDFRLELSSFTDEEEEAALLAAPLKQTKETPKLGHESTKGICKSIPQDKEDASKLCVAEKQESVSSQTLLSGNAYLKATSSSVFGKEDAIAPAVREDDEVSCNSDASTLTLPSAPETNDSTSSDGMCDTSLKAHGKDGKHLSNFSVGVLVSQEVNERGPAGERESLNDQNSTLLSNSELPDATNFSVCDKQNKPETSPAVPEIRDVVSYDSDTSTLSLPFALETNESTSNGGMCVTSSKAHDMDKCMLNFKDGPLLSHIVNNQLDAEKTNGLTNSTVIHDKECTGAIDSSAHQDEAPESAAVPKDRPSNSSTSTLSLPSAQGGVAQIDVENEACNNVEIPYGMNGCSEDDLSGKDREITSALTNSPVNGNRTARQENALEKEAGNVNDFVTLKDCQKNASISSDMSFLIAEIATLGKNLQEALPYNRSLRVAESSSISEDLHDINREFRRKNSVFDLPSKPIALNHASRIDREPPSTSLNPDFSNESKSSDKRQLDGDSGLSVGGEPLTNAHANESLSLELADQSPRDESNTLRKQEDTSVENQHQKPKIHGTGQSEPLPSATEEVLGETDGAVSGDQNPPKISLSQSEESAESDGAVKQPDNEELNSECARKCDVCAKTFASPHQLRLHGYIKHTIDYESVPGQIYHCRECSYESSSQIQTYDHESAHMGLVPLERLLILFSSVKEAMRTSVEI